MTKRIHNLGPYAEALDFAIAAHGNQMYGEKPYFHHLMDVAAITSACYEADITDMLSTSFSDYPHSKYVIQAALLHDVIEDTDVTEVDLIKTFGLEVASLVACVSDPVGPSRKKRKQAFYQMWANNQLTFDVGARVIKIADRICNHDYAMSQRNLSKLTMYLGEYPTFKHIMVTSEAKKHPAVRAGADLLEFQVPVMVETVGAILRDLD